MGLRRTQCLKDYTLTKQGVKLGCGTGQEKGMGGRGNKRRAERGREQNQDGARGAEASLFYSSLSWPQRHATPQLPSVRVVTHHTSTILISSSSSHQVRVRVPVLYSKYEKNSH